eukprot:TRINITY_DN1723_c0_g1_i1.p1 TRINITY_DN1723_c0_g1~~TRINITY_DN1723_c0_g1_i1.p1  ORF type:complete len:318 (-),score=56.38 TRINITY_DN1723_c0_g1_i1:314-1267(-)
MIEETAIVFPATALAWSLVVGLVVATAFGLWQRNRKTGLPPGSLGWPLLGETLQLISAYKSSNPEPFVDYRRSRYGSVFKTHVFGKPTIFSTDADVNKFILQNEGKLFEASYPTSIANLLGKNSLLVMTGGLHKRLHSVTLNFASSSSVLKDTLLFNIERLICLALDGWKDKVLLQEEAKKITFELTVKQLLSFDPGEWSENLRKQYLKLIDGFFSIPFPLPFTTYRNALKARAKVAEELRLVVRKRREKEEEWDNEEFDMLGVLVRDAETSLSDEQIVDLLVSLLVAGYETTSTIMTLCVKFLTESPQALAQLKVI